MDIDQKKLEERIARGNEQITACRGEISSVLVGQETMVTGMLMSVIAGGHVLLEGVPGLAKTLAVKAVADVIDASFKRIQFTPDLLPADLTGTMIFRQQTGEFVPRKGPIFSNIVLADEINRAPAKVQSALLEAMQEKQVTIGDNTHTLPDPFFVLATQNPIEQEGTYPLPEAQLDRFLMKLFVEYPSKIEELQILRKQGVEAQRPLKRILFKSDIKRLREVVDDIRIDERIELYIVEIVGATRKRTKNHRDVSRYLEYGASPRGSIYLYRCAKIQAFLDGRGYVIPDDVKAVANPVLRHRLVLSYEAESEMKTADEIVGEILSTVPVP
jgi:MoxR-like ATPase